MQKQTRKLGFYDQFSSFHLSQSSHTHGQSCLLPHHPASLCRAGDEQAMNFMEEKKKFSAYIASELLVSTHRKHGTVTLGKVLQDRRENKQPETKR